MGTRLMRIGLVTALLIAAVGLGLWVRLGRSDRGDDFPDSSGIRLGLSTAAAAALATDSSTFPKDQAGLAAYVQIKGGFDLQKASTAFDKLVKSGGNWLVGQVTVNVYPSWDVHPTKTRNVNVYIDSQGWIVAYDGSGSPAADITVWTDLNKDNPAVQQLGKTTLERAIQKTTTAVGVDFASLSNNVGYYFFPWPAATNLTVVGNVVKGTQLDFQFSVASDSLLYKEALTNNDLGVSFDTISDVSGTRRVTPRMDGDGNIASGPDYPTSVCGMDFHWCGPVSGTAITVSLKATDQSSPHVLGAVVALIYKKP